MEKLNVENEEPKEVLKFFKEISEIPRKSGNEEKIKDYLVNFAQKRKLEVLEDKNYNVIIRKKGIKNKETLALQAHTDMICEKTKESKHNFEKDPIILYEENGYIKANGTTLGADNGIGVAQILAILDDKKLKTPCIEAIFTVQEETTMIGAKEIDLSKLKSKKIISLDGGREGKILVGSANCLEWSTCLEKDYTEIPKGFVEYELVYSNFKGGHSGGNIGDPKRGNPIKLGIQTLQSVDDIYISEISGGSRVNVIPRDFKIRFFMKKSMLKRVEKTIKQQKESFENSIIEITQNNKNSKCFSKELTNRIIGFIGEYENGGLEYKDGNIVLSCNMADIKETEKEIFIEFSTRANDLKLRDKYLERLDNLIEKYNLRIDWKQELKGVNQDINNSLIAKCERVYEKLYNKKLEKIITQGVVEGGFFSDKIKNLEYVCIGPDTEDVHSPNERLSINSLKNTWKFLKSVVEE